MSNSAPRPSSAPTNPHRPARARLGLALGAAGLAFGAGQVAGPEERFWGPKEWHGFSAPALACGLDGSVWSVFLGHDGEGDAVLAARVDGEDKERWPEVLGRASICLSPCAVSLGPQLLVVWSAKAGSEFDLHYRLGGPAGAGEWQWSEVTRLGAPGAEHAPKLAAAPDGSAWLVYEARRDGASTISARRFAEGAFGEELELHGTEARSEGQPSVACAPDGTAWIAWTSWRHASYASGDSEIYALALAPDGKPRGTPARVSRDPAADLAPSLASVSGAIALSWTRASVESMELGGLIAACYDTWSNRRFAVAWEQGAGWSEPYELSMAKSGTPLMVGDEACALGAGPAGEVLLFFDEILQGHNREQGGRALRVVRARPGGASQVLDVAADWTDRVILPALAREDDRLWFVEAAPRVGASAGEKLPRRGLRVREILIEELEAAGDSDGSEAREPGPAEPAIDPAQIPDLAQRSGERPRAGEWQAWFGNLHLHSSMSRDGVESDGLPAWNLRAVRDVARLDFVALTDHSGRGLDETEWREELRLLELWDEPGRFATFPGYEWTSPRYGHKNVIFRALEEAAATAPLDASTHKPTMLFEHLGARLALAIPHHPSHGTAGGTDWSFGDEEHQRLMEVFQKRGSYEYDGAPLQQSGEIGKFNFFPGLSARDALDRGHRLGLIASPDHGGGLGLAGVWSSELTREDVFDALHSRRTFGTTGAKMALFLEVNGAPLGSAGVPAPGGRVAVQGRVFGTTSGLELTIVAGGLEVAVERHEGPLAEIHWEGVLPAGAEPYLYLRARQSDGHIGWSSPVWLEP